MGPLLFGSGDSNVVGFDTATPDELQWGRCFLAAEMNRLVVSGSWPKKLQWGRCFLAAEIPTRSTFLRTRPLGFNGAAAFWQRRSAPRSPSSRAPSPLQWGRCFLAAEMSAT